MPDIPAPMTMTSRDVAMAPALSVSDRCFSRRTPCPSSSDALQSPASHGRQRRLARRAPTMDFGINLATAADSFKIVKRAEELGYARAWFYDTQMLNADVFVAMG